MNSLKISKEMALNGLINGNKGKYSMKQHKFTELETSICEDIVKILRKGNFWPCGAITYRVDILHNSETRKHIQLIRRHSLKFLKPNEFLLANHKGYWISADKDEIRAFYKKTLIRHQNTTPQLLQIERILSKEK